MLIIQYRGRHFLERPEFSRNVVFCDFVFSSGDKKKNEKSRKPRTAVFSAVKEAGNRGFHGNAQLTTPTYTGQRLPQLPSRLIPSGQSTVVRSGNEAYVSELLQTYKSLVPVTLSKKISI